MSQKTVMPVSQHIYSVTTTVVPTHQIVFLMMHFSMWLLTHLSTDIAKFDMHKRVSKSISTLNCVYIHDRMGELLRKNQAEMQAIFVYIRRQFDIALGGKCIIEAVDNIIPTFCQIIVNMSTAIESELGKLSPDGTDPTLTLCIMLNCIKDTTFDKKKETATNSQFFMTN